MRKFTLIIRPNKISDSSNKYYYTLNTYNNNNVILYRITYKDQASGVKAI